MILISWASYETRAQPEGGDALELVYDSILIDGTTGEQYHAGATATEHAIEGEADASEHVRPGLRDVSLDIIVSAHPGPSSPANSVLLGSTDAADRPRAIREALDRLVATGQIVEIETDVRTYENVLILDVSEDRRPETGDAYVAQLRIRELKIVSTETIEAPSPRVERGRRSTDRGRQGTEDRGLVDALANRGTRSVSRVLTDWLAGGQQL